MSLGFYEFGLGLGFLKCFLPFICHLFVVRGLDEVSSRVQRIFGIFIEVVNLLFPKKKRLLTFLKRM